MTGRRGLALSQNSTLDLDSERGWFKFRPTYWHHGNRWWRRHFLFESLYLTDWNGCTDLQSKLWQEKDTRYQNILAWFLSASMSFYPRYHCCGLPWFAPADLQDPPSWFQQLTWDKTFGLQLLDLRPSPFFFFQVRCPSQWVCNDTLNNTSLDQYYQSCQDDTISLLFFHFCKKNFKKHLRSEKMRKMQKWLLIKPNKLNHICGGTSKCFQWKEMNQERMIKSRESNQFKFYSLLFFLLEIMKAASS